MQPPGLQITHEYDSTKTRRALSHHLDQRIIALGLWRLRDLSLASRVRGSTHEAQILVRHPSTSNPLDTTYHEKEHPLDEGLRLIAADDGPEAQLQQREQALTARRNAEEAAQAAAVADLERASAQRKWDAMSPSVRALVLVAARLHGPGLLDDQKISRRELRTWTASSQRTLLLDVAHALNDNALDTVPAEAVEFINSDF
jgi:hypothetical protein